MAGAQSSERRNGALTDQRLATIRSLLSKAEGTEFPAEAEAFTAKASELMARYSLDEALLWANDGISSSDTAGPTEIQMTVHAPYLTQKSYLVGAVADAHGCRTVRFVASRGSRTEVVSLVGFGTDLAMLEALITSLFVQMGIAMGQVSPPASSPAGVSAWRRSFIMGFAESVSERIASSRAAAAKSTDSRLPTNAQGTSLAVALRDRQAMIDDELRRRHPRLGQSRISVGSSSHGRRHGQQAGTRADLGGARLKQRKALSPTTR